MYFKKYLISLVFLLFSLSSFAQQGDIYALVNGDSVTIWHVATVRNCATVFEMEMTLEGNQISLLENDIYGQLAYCMCSFDLSAGIGNLIAGNYDVDVYSREAINNWDTVYWGSTSFTILSSGQGTPQIISEYQSDCYLNLPPPENIQLEIECNTFSFSTTTGKSPSSFLGFNLYINDVLVGFFNDLATPYFDPLTNGSYHICLTAVYDEGESLPVCWDVEVPYGDPATGFQIEPSANGSLLTWSTPDGYVKSMTGFHVFRDYELLSPSLVSDTFYIDENIALNTLYQYYVTVVYDDCESLPTDTLEFILTDVPNSTPINFQFSPNPVTTLLNIKSTNPVLSCQIFDLFGKEYLRQRALGSSFQLDISMFPSGVYFILIETEVGIQTNKIVIL